MKKGFFMKALKREIGIGIVFAVIAGTLSHFVYEWLGENPIAAIFFPIDESVWEHVKLLFFPTLLLLFVSYKKVETNLSLYHTFCACRYCDRLTFHTGIFLFLYGNFRHTFACFGHTDFYYQCFYYILCDL